MTPSHALIFVRVSVAALLTLGLLPSSTRAQGTARSMDIETSIRAAGMGGASSGVWWGEPGVWGNPASLANTQGIGWLDGHTQLVPGLATDVFLDTRRLLVGGGGLGLSFMGAPFDGLGKLRLDYGSSVSTDPFGNPTGNFTSFEEVEGWGLGVSPLRLFDNARHLLHGGEEPAVRPFDVALGIQHKHAVVALAPTSFGVIASGDTWDWGVTGRLSLLPATNPTAPVHLDISGGFSVLNANDEQFVFVNEDQSSPPTRTRRMGIAMHAALPSPWAGGSESAVRLLVAPVHALEIGFAFDTDRVSAGGTEPHFNVQHFGVEATVLGVLTGRLGHYSDRTGQIVDDTFGYGFRLPIGPWGAFQYDHATVPQANNSGLPDVQRRGWSVWIDPVRIFGSIHSAR